MPATAVALTTRTILSAGLSPLCRIIESPNALGEKESRTQKQACGSEKRMKVAE